MDDTDFQALQNRKLSLIEVLGGDSRRFCEIRDPVEQSRELNKFYLQHIFNQLGLTLSKLTSRTWGQELPHWDNRHLYTLAETLPLYLGNKADTEKLRYLIKHNVQGDLHERFAARDEQDKFSIYARKVIADLHDFGINEETWMRPAPRPKYFSSKNPEKPFDLEAKLWTRDFRKEYAIGNISECCIALDTKPDKQQYKSVLLDYFLDPAVNVARLRRIDEDGNLERIGQIYMVPLVSLGKVNRKGKITEGECEGLMLGITSVELNTKYRNDVDLVPPIVNSILNQEGYREDYNFDTVLIGERFNLVKNYFGERKQKLYELRLRLKELCQDKRNKKKLILDDPEEVGKINSMLATLNYDLATVEDLLEDFHPPVKLAVQKFGLRRTDYTDTYRGSNYFDILGTGEDGFINIDAPYQRAQGFYSGVQTKQRFLETKMKALTNKYKKRN